MNITLRPYQNEATDAVRQSYLQGYLAPLLTLPTGGGKTVIFTYISKQASERGKRVMILVHRVELLRQTLKALRHFGVEAGAINPKFTPNPSANVQVASVQTLVRRLHITETPDLVIVDECHHATAGSWRKIMEYFPNAKFLGVTATPVRTDGTGLNTMFDKLIIGPQISELIELDYLSQPIVYAPENKIDLKDVSIKRGDYDSVELNDIIDKPTITGNAVEHYHKISPGSPAVAFCVSIKHAEHVAERFRRKGYRAYSVDGSMDDDLRDKILSGLGNGSVDVVTSCDLISEGTDIPEIVTAILLRPTKSMGLYLQQVGRALRPSPGKEFAYILDHVGNTFEHGMPDANREWSLDGRKKGKRGKRETEPSLRVLQCENCFNIHKPQPVCPNCGFVHPNGGRTPEEVEGQLKAVQEMEEIRKKKSMRDEVRQARTLEELKEIEKKRGYKRGWAKYLYESREKKK